MERRSFFKLLAAAGLGSHLDAHPLFAAPAPGSYQAAAIPNLYYRFLPGEREALATPPVVTAIASGIVHLGTGATARTLEAGASTDGWALLTVVDMNGVPTAVFEKRATYRGTIAFVTADRGAIASIPTFIGDLATIAPRPVAAPADKQLRRTRTWVAGPDLPGQYLLDAAGDPTWETVAALGPEFLGWTLVANEQAGPERSLFLDEQGNSRELNNIPQPRPPGHPTSSAPSSTSASSSPATTSSSGAIARATASAPCSAATPPPPTSASGMRSSAAATRSWPSCPRATTPSPSSASASSSPTNRSRPT